MAELIIDFFSTSSTCCAVHWHRKSCSQRLESSCEFLEFFRCWRLVRSVRARQWRHRIYSFQLLKPDLEQFATRKHFNTLRWGSLHARRRHGDDHWICDIYNIQLLLLLFFSAEFNGNSSRWWRERVLHSQWHTQHSKQQRKISNI